MTMAMFTNDRSQHKGNKEDVFPINTTYIPNYLKQLSKTELSEDEDTKIKSLQLLRSVLREKAEFTWQDEDLFLLAFLRVRKFDITRAFNLIKNFYTGMDKYGFLFSNFNFERVRNTLQHMKIGYLPYRDSDGCVIFVYHLVPWDPQINSMADNMITINCLFHVAVRSPATQIAGIKMIVDCSGLSFSHIRHMPLSYVYMSAQMFHDFFPARFRAVHIVNEGVIIPSLWTVFKRFLSMKIQERFHFHGNNVRKLHKYFSPSILPAEFLGELPAFDNSSTLREAIKFSDYITSIFSFGFQKHD